jgi:translocation and assembly module TamB
MTRAQRIGVQVGIVVASLLLIVLLALLVLVQTDRGREQVRRVVLSQIESALDARVEIGRLEGNLIRTWRFVDVSITDLEGRPFVVADTITTRFSLGNLIRRRIVLRDPRVVRAVIVLDHPPGEEWNYARILPTPDPDPTRPGWGDWIRLHRVTIIDSRITIRSEWKPDPELPPAERERKIAEALDPEQTRANIQPVPGGFQNVMDFRGVHARLNEVLLADPDVDRTEVDVATMRAIAEPYRPPVADVRHLSGRFYISGDSIWFPEVSARLPASRLEASGVYDLQTASLVLRMEGDPAAFADLRWLYPRLPEEGGGQMRLAVHVRQAATRLELEDMDLRLGAGELAGDLRLMIGDTIRILPTDLTFSRLDTRPVDRMIPGLELPVHGTLDGRLALQGRPESMRVDGDVVLTHARTGQSRVVATGGLGMGEDVRFSNLRLTFSPLRTDLVRGEVPRLPPGATLTGHAALNGTLGGPLRLDADVALTDPATGRSRVVAAGTLDPRRDGTRFSGFDMRFQPLRADLVRPEMPFLPAASTIAGRLRLDGSTGGTLNVDGDLAITDPSSGESRVAATGGLDLRDELRFRGLDLRFHPLQLDLVRGEMPELPPGAVVTGRLRLDGDPRGLLRLDGDVAVADPATGGSRVAGDGAVDMTGELAFRGLRLRFDPLQVPLVQRFQPDLPLGGTLSGHATLDGRPGTRLAVRGDLTHRESGETSRVAGVVQIVPGDRARVDVRLMPLSLAIAGRFAPEAGLHGEVRGDLQASGTMNDLSVRADLVVSEGGEITASGQLNLAAAEPTYDLVSRLRNFDLAAVTARAPATTDLTGDVEARGRGLDPATMRAEVRADLVGSAVDDAAADEVRLRLEIVEGLARVDSSVVHVGSVVAWADGDFGLVAWRDGELRYQVHLDDLQAVAPLLPELPDTAIVTPRPPVRQAALAEAREEAARAERRRLVELIATGNAPPMEPVPLDTLALAGIPRDTVAGRAEAEGVLRGNIESFDAAGTAEVENLVFGGHYIGRGEAEYSWIRRGVPSPIIEVDAAAERLIIEGFALDSAVLAVRHLGERQGGGSAVLAAWQDDETDYRLNAEYTLALDRNALQLHDLALRFDTLTWRSAQPGAISWDADVIAVETIELVSDAGGLIFLDGVLPLEGEADLRVVLREVELAHLGILLQDDREVTGRVSLETQVQGTLRAPVFEGVGIVADASRNGQVLPDARLSFAYGNAQLRIGAELFEGEGGGFATADATLPIDLALVDQRGSRLIDGPLIVDIRADSLPLDGIGALTDELSRTRGMVAGQLSIGGTWTAPAVEGDVTIADAEFLINATGVRYENVAGRLRLAGSNLVVDSLAAHAGGPVHVTGTVSLSPLTEPTFDLEITAENAWAMRTDDVRLRVDADLSVTGPFDRVVVSGDARTRRSVIYIPEARDKALVSLDQPELLDTLEGRMLAAAEDIMETPSPLLANLEVDVNLRIEPDTWIRSTDYNIEIYTPAELPPLHLQLDQRAGRLTVEGTVNSDRGEYSFMGRRFRVTRGAATFVGAAEPDPLIQIAVEHEVQLPGREAFSIRVILGGTALSPTITVESDARPPIAETDIFTYIALGRSAGAVLQQQGSALSGHGSPSGDMVGNVAGLATMQMAALAANTLLDQFESEMARELGLDVLHIAPADLPAELFEGSIGDLLRGTEVEAGRYIGPRLFASVRTRFTTETRPGATVEYSTPNGFRWTGNFQPRFMPREPTLRDVEPDRASVFGAFMFREWRF